MEWLSCIGLFGSLLALVGFSSWIFGLTIIGVNQVGIVEKKMSRKSLPAGSLIALNGEAGIQADILSPGWHMGFYPWAYRIVKERVTVVDSGKLAILSSRDGLARPESRILGCSVPSQNFQDARAFLRNGGEKGPQIQMLTAGTYRINTALFEIIGEVSVTLIKSDQVGVVTTLAGSCLSQGEIAGHLTEGHESFQDAQRFLDQGGQKGLQEQLLLAGSWNLNPLFAQVEIFPITEIPIGYAGVVISYVGKEHEDISGADFKHGDLVEQGHKGVWAEPLYPGKHPINPKTAKVELVPTTNVALNWADNRSESHRLDANLSAIKVRSKDGFSFVLDVTQVLHVGAKEAAKVVLRFGSMRNLVEQVLEPAIGNYFRNSAQNHTVLDFLSARSERQTDALSYIRAALSSYDIETVDTYIGDIVPPSELMKTQTDKKLAEERKGAYAAQEAAEVQRQSFQKEQALAEIQGQLVASEQSVKMQDFKTQLAIKVAEGDAQGTKLRAEADASSTRVRGIAEADALQAIGLAKAETYRAGVAAMGPDNYGKLQVMTVVGEKRVKLIPDMLIQGGGDSNTPGMLTSALLADLLKERVSKHAAPVEAEAVS